ncbi:hypothetical protein QQG55_39060 [Brugia pahangi]
MLPQDSIQSSVSMITNGQKHLLNHLCNEGSERSRIHDKRLTNILRLILSKNLRNVWLILHNFWTKA